MTTPLVQVKGLKVHFPLPPAGLFQRERRWVKAVDGIYFTISRGETLGLVGESGCGKSTVARALLRLIEPTEGKILFEGKDLTRLNREELRRERRHFQMIFQDPFASLNPRMTVGDIVAEPLKTFNVLAGKALKQEVQNLLRWVGLDPRYIRRYPHEFSGGQRQRIGIARALALKPKLIVADEPVSALDVSIQAQILNLLSDLKKRFQLTYLFIAHDLAIVRHVSDRIAVMYLGKIVEMASYQEIYESPKHPYTQALLLASPIPDPIKEKARQKQRQAPLGEPPSPITPPSGCAFHPRCPYAMLHCKTIIPPLKEYTEGHHTACHLLEKK